MQTELQHTRQTTKKLHFWRETSYSPALSQLPEQSRYDSYANKEPTTNNC